MVMLQAANGSYRVEARRREEPTPHLWTGTQLKANSFEQITKSGIFVQGLENRIDRDEHRFEMLPRNRDLEFVYRTIPIAKQRFPPGPAPGVVPGLPRSADQDREHRLQPSCAGSLHALLCVLGVTARRDRLDASFDVPHLKQRLALPLPPGGIAWLKADRTVPSLHSLREAFQKIEGPRANGVVAWMEWRSPESDIDLLERPGEVTGRQQEQRVRGPYCGVGRLPPDGPLQMNPGAVPLPLIRQQLESEGPVARPAVWIERDAPLRGFECR